MGSRFRRLAVLPVVAVVLAACSGSDGGGEVQQATDRKAETTAEANVPAEPLRGERLVAALRRGGYVIYFRHAATDPVPDDAEPVVLSDCETQRNLSAEGRRQSRAIGRAIERLEIPIGRVLASPFCRTLDTARLAFETASADGALENLETAEEGEREARIEALRSLLSTRPEAGANTALVAHGFNIAAAADVTIDEGEAAVFEPRGGDAFDLVARLAPREWSALARAGRGDELAVREFPVPPGSHPHDVAPARDGTVWYTAQGSGELGRLDPETGKTRAIPLGEGSAPHGVIVSPDGAPWITDGGLNAIVRVDPMSEEVQVFPLPESAGYANLNTATFDRRGILWFTGQGGIYGRLDPDVGRVEVFEAPRGSGPYGITTTPGGDVYYASLAGSHIARIDTETGAASVLEPPTTGQGARRVWSDSRGRIWVSEWNAGQLGMYEPSSGSWREWRLPGAGPQPYAVYVDERDFVWVSDFGANALVRFDPRREAFEVVELPSEGANVRQLLGRPREVWGAESGVDKLVRVRTP
jgi:virginiamycin B lyase